MRLYILACHGSYDSSLSVRVDEASRYNMSGYVIEVER